MRRALLALLAAVVASGCPAHLTEAGARVRIVSADALPRCTRLAPVSFTAANGASTADNEAVATDRVRNEVAALGGNAFHVTARDVGRFRTVVHADALRCPEWEPVRGLPPR